MHHSSAPTILHWLQLPEVEGPLYIDVSVLLLFSLPTLLLRTDTPLHSRETSWVLDAGLCTSSMGQRHLRGCCLRQADSKLDCLGGKLVSSRSHTSDIVVGAHSCVTAVLPYSRCATNSGLSQAPRFSHLGPCADR